MTEAQIWPMAPMAMMPFSARLTLCAILALKPSVWFCYCGSSAFGYCTLAGTVIRY